MALIENISRISKDTAGSHKRVDCTWTVVEQDGERFLQLDTYGSDERQMLNKVSQSLRFNKQAAAQLRAILEEIYPSTVEQ